MAPIVEVVICRLVEVRTREVRVEAKGVVIGTRAVTAAIGVDLVSVPRLLALVVILAVEVTSVRETITSSHSSSTRGKNRVREFVTRSLWVGWTII